MRDDESSLHHSALPPGLAPLRLLSAFWEESRRLAPTRELHVVDPYLLDARKEDPSRHASSIAQLLTPSLRDLSVITCVYRKESIGVRNALEAYVSQLAPSGLLVRFVKPSHFHHRWVVADRMRVALLDISFNQIGRALGGIHLVTKEADAREYLAALEMQDPRSPIENLQQDAKMSLVSDH